MSKDKCDRCHQWLAGCKGHNKQVLCPTCFELVLSEEQQHSFEEVSAATPIVEAKEPEQLNMFMFMKR